MNEEDCSKLRETAGSRNLGWNVDTVCPETAAGLNIGCSQCQKVCEIRKHGRGRDGRRDCPSVSAAAAECAE